MTTYTNIILAASILLFTLSSCTQENSSEVPSVDPAVTQQVLDHHWKTFVENDLEGVMADYTEESILITPDTTYRGLDAIRDNFISAFEAFPAGESTLTLKKSVVEQEVGYILWEASTENFDLIFATDTFIIRDGKIVRQTYGGITAQEAE
ncbi:nuclear transport factor 2 family protein [Halalkalibaculum sp. DA3122]|uniref:nuclear transport factor 2 family protein n=1 Tax=Halalkalibaculum sp. DA3122 TaxID=3373607 RepID=UPI0037553F71